MCVSRSLIVISRLAGTAPYRPLPAGPGTSTVVDLNAGKYFETGSASRSRPSSISMTAATEVTALVIDAMRKIVSFRIGSRFSTSIQPTGSSTAILPALAMTTTAPAI